MRGLSRRIMSASRLARTFSLLSLRSWVHVVWRPYAAVAESKESWMKATIVCLHDQDDFHSIHERERIATFNRHMWVWSFRKIESQIGERSLKMLLLRVPLDQT